MSRQALEWVRRLTHTAAGRRLAPLERRALDELAWRHDEDRGRVAPKIRELAEALPAGERTAQGLLRRFEAEGILAPDLSVPRTGGRGHARAYRFVGLDDAAGCLSPDNGASAAPLLNSNGAGTAPFPPLKGANGDTPFPPDPLSPCAKNRTQKTSGRPAASPVRPDGPRAGFARFWVAYPRRTAKGRAERAWAKLAPEGDLVAGILAALERQKRAGLFDDPKFTPHPATWLNDRRWEDEPAAPTGNGWVPSDACLDFCRAQLERNAGISGSKAGAEAVWAEAMRLGYAGWQRAMREGADGR